MSLLVFVGCMINQRVVSLPVSTAKHILQKWIMEVKIQDENLAPDDLDLRITDDSFSGPFKLEGMEATENEDISHMHNVMNWVQTETFYSTKGIFAAIIDEEEKMMGFIQKYKNKIQVHGFLSRPNIDAETHETVKQMLALEFLEIASSAEKNILFLFEEEE